MNGTNAVIDSDVIIYASKRLINIDDLVSRYDKLYTSIISYMEVYAFDFVNAHEKILIDELFKNLKIVETDRQIADHAIVYRSNKSRKIKLPDSIILATAKTLSADLITNNLVDFQGVDESVSIVGINDLRI